MLSAGIVQGHRWGEVGCSATSCDYVTRRRRRPRQRQRHFLSTFPRQYQYLQSGPFQSYRRQRDTAMDLVSKNFLTPLCGTDFGNSLFRHHRSSRRGFEAPDFDIPYSIEDFGDSGIELLMELPGVDANDVSVELQKDTNILVISASRRQSANDGSFTSQMEISRSFQMANNIDVDGIQAALSAGILTVSLPLKVPTEHGRTSIPIRVLEHEEKNETDEEKTVELSNDSDLELEQPKELHDDTATATRHNMEDDDDFQILDEEDAWE